MRAVIPAEVVTTVIAVFLGFHLPWNSSASVLQGSQFVMVALGALAVALGAGRQAPWTPKAAAILAALSGATNLSTFAGILLVMGHHPGPGVLLSCALVSFLGLCQLWALFLGLSQLQIRQAAV